MSPSNVKSCATSHLAGKTNESGLLRLSVPQLPVECLHLFRPDCTQQVWACKRAIFMVPLVSILLWRRLGVAVFSHHCSGSSRDPWESANPPCEFAMCGPPWEQLAPISFFFRAFSFLILGFLNLLLVTTASGTNRRVPQLYSRWSISCQPICPGFWQTSKHMPDWDCPSMIVVCGNFTVDSCSFTSPFGISRVCVEDALKGPPCSVSAGMRRSAANAALTPSRTCLSSATSSCSWWWFACCLWLWSCLWTSLGTS